LHQKLEGRPVFIVEHMDEAHYHTHFLVFEKDEQHPRSMNLKKADLRALRWDIGKNNAANSKKRRVRVAGTRRAKRKLGV